MSPDDSAPDAGLAQNAVTPEGIDTALVRARVQAGLFAWLPPPVRIGRYAILRRLGSGGMGIVYAGFDDALGREVAIKLVRVDGVERPDPEASARLRREAHALARVAHPNVVTVHEVGDHDGAPFVAMEFVRGSTLREWLTARPRSRREILDALRQALRGLVAVHDAGLVHRDIKPENIMVGDDDRVRLMDFGLASIRERSNWLLDTDPGAASVVESIRVTSGAFVGTPAYMAPEQFEGGHVDARTDQFGFCVVAWEAIIGTRPFAGTRLAELAENVVSGRRVPIEGAAMPKWLRRVLERGLSKSPEARWPSTRDLAMALARDPWRRAAGGIGALSAIALALAVGGGMSWADARRSAACSDRASQLGDAWDDAARTSVTGALVATGVAYADDTAERVVDGLDAYADRFMDVQREACESAEAQWAPELRTGAAQCLAERKQALAATAAVLAEADEKTVERAVQVVQSLPDVEVCTEVAYLAQVVRPPDDPQVAAHVDELRAQLARATALDEAAAYREALALSESIVEEAAAIGYAPFRAAALSRLAHVREGLGDYEQAVALAREGYTLAVTSADDHDAATLATYLVLLHGYRLGKPKAALDWAFVATPQVHRVERGGELEANLLDAVGTAHLGAGDTEAALVSFRDALVIRERISGPAAAATATTLSNLGAAAFAGADFQTALDAFTRSLEISEAALGQWHPEVADRLQNLGAVHQRLGLLDEASAELERANAIREAVLGSEHPMLAEGLDNLALVRFSQARYPETLELYRRAYALRERAHGPRHPDVATSHDNIGSTLDALGRFDEAYEEMQLAFEIREEALGPDHPDVGYSLNNVAAMLGKRGDTDGELAYFLRALAVFERAKGEHGDIKAMLHGNIGGVHEVRGQLDEALSHYETALALREKTFGSEHVDVAQSIDQIGALYMVRGDLERAAEYQLRALAMREKLLGPDHPSVARSLQQLGEVKRRAGNASDAVELLERALVLLEHQEQNPDVLAETRFSLARALWSRGGARPRALSLARLARDAFAAGPKNRMFMGDEVDVWLAAVGAGEKGR